jgi:hypothetical protein
MRSLNQDGDLNRDDKFKVTRIECEREADKKQVLRLAQDDKSKKGWAFISRAISQGQSRQDWRARATLQFVAQETP